MPLKWIVALAAAAMVCKAGATVWRDLRDLDEALWASHERQNENWGGGA